MKAILFVFGFVIGTLFGAGIFIYRDLTKAPPSETDILFAQKNYYDFQEMAVNISGTLTGDGLAYPNNTYAISCLREKGDCWVASVEQIGSGQVGRMDNPYWIPITKWDQSEVVAQEEENTFSCARTVLTIDRLSKAALVVFLPINQTSPNCAKAETKIRKYSIEDSPGWKRLTSKR